MKKIREIDESFFLLIVVGAVFFVAIVANLIEQRQAREENRFEVCPLCGK